jgi:hypothetical protein
MAQGQPREQNLPFFWPHEKGRPFATAEDFLVHVNFVTLRDERPAIEGMRRLQSSFQDLRDNPNLSLSPSRIEHYGTLSCLINLEFKIESTICANPDDTGIPVFLRGGLRPSDPHSFANGYAYSPSDKIQLQFQFPTIGIPRWQEAVCWAYLLIRRWRVSDGPPPGDCSKLPRSSSIEPKVRRGHHG